MSLVNGSLWTPEKWLKIMESYMGWLRCIALHVILGFACCQLDVHVALLNVKNPPDLSIATFIKCFVV